MQTVLPAKVFRRGVMLIMVTVLSPIGLTTLYTGSADPPCTATDCCAAAATLQTTRTNESTSAQQTLRKTDALQDALRMRQGSKRLIVIGSIVIDSSHGHRRAHTPQPVPQRHPETGRAPRSRCIGSWTGSSRIGLVSSLVPMLPGTRARGKASPRMGRSGTPEGARSGVPERTCRRHVPFFLRRLSHRGSLPGARCLWPSVW